MDDEWRITNNNPLEDFDDEDESNVKESWEDEDDEKKDEPKIPAPVVPKPPKKTAKPTKAVSKSEVEAVELTDEEKAAEKLRIQYEQEQSDLCMALETTFSGAQTIQIDNLFPVRKEDFQELNNALSKKFQSFNKSAEYYHFVEQHIRNICASMTSAELKNIRLTVSNLCSEKQKLENAEKSKKVKPKSKATLKLKNEKIDDFSTYNDYGDEDDFM